MGRARIRFGAFLVFMLAAPWMLPEFRVTPLDYVGLYSIASPWVRRRLPEPAGLISFGQAAFVGLGAHAST